MVVAFNSLKLASLTYLVLGFLADDGIRRLIAHHYQSVEPFTSSGRLNSFLDMDGADASWFVSVMGLVFDHQQAECCADGSVNGRL